jgi:hypothetical protein
MNPRTYINERSRVHELHAREYTTNDKQDGEIEEINLILSSVIIIGVGAVALFLILVVIVVIVVTALFVFLALIEGKGDILITQLTVLDSQQGRSYIGH